MYPSDCWKPAGKEGAPVPLLEADRDQDGDIVSVGREQGVPVPLLETDQEEGKNIARRPELPYPSDLIRPNSIVEQQLGGYHYLEIERQSIKKLLFHSGQDEV